MTSDIARELHAGTPRTEPTDRTVSTHADLLLGSHGHFTARCPGPAPPATTHDPRQTTCPECAD